MPKRGIITLIKQQLAVDGKAASQGNGAPASPSCVPSQPFDVTPQMVAAGAAVLMKRDLAWEPYEAIARDVLQAAAESSLVIIPRESATQSLFTVPPRLPPKR